MLVDILVERVERGVDPVELRVDRAACGSGIEWCCRCGQAGAASAMVMAPASKRLAGMKRGMGVILLTG
jgi:hypothetical protein